MINYITNQKVEIDIHHMTKESARKYLEQFLSKVDGSVKEVQIIHGYTGGTVLRDMVRNGLKHKRIKSKVRSLNDGITILIL
ncbi:MAG: Smr protein/MutS2 [Oscillospiraceae bacterium]|jgi:DNA-nicking Smr family endonuclease|nr:Smr protein/MutS2 [Oscillospiraceae bacterium]